MYIKKKKTNKDIFKKIYKYYLLSNRRKIKKTKHSTS